MVTTAAKRPRRDTVSTAARLRKQPPSLETSGIVARVTYTADYVSELPQEILERASQLLKGCWPGNRHVERMVTNLLEVQGSVELHSTFKAASGVAFRSGDKASSEQLQLRLALEWEGDVVTACCLYTNSHEEQREAPQHVRASREQARERRTEIVLFGVQGEWRRQRVGSALLAYVTYLAKVHQSTKLLVMFNKHNEGVRNFWLRTFGDKELALHDRSYCTIFTNSSEHVLALHELSLVSTPLVNTFEELCAMTKEATRRLPADITSSQDKPIPTAEGPETGCLLFWVNMVDRRFFPAKCLGIGQDLVGEKVHKYAFIASETETVADAPRETVAEAPSAPHRDAPKEITWREVKPLAAKKFRGPNYNTFFHPSAAPEAAKHEPKFAEHVAMQRLPPPLPLPKPKGKERKAEDLAVAEQQDDGQAASYHCVHLCAGTAIQSCTMAAKYDYSVVIVDDGAGGSDCLLQYNPFWVKRPEVNLERPWPGPQLELDRLSTLLQSQGRAEGGDHPRRLVLLQRSTFTLDPHQMRLPSVALLDTSCRTRSTNSQPWHQRNASNFQLGVTAAALKDDIEFAKQLVLLQWWQHKRDKQGRPFRFTVENPRATIEAHPLTRKCLLLHRAAGGLGGKARHFCNCWFPSSSSKVHHKPGVLITNNKTLLDGFANGKYMCRESSQCPRRAAGRKHDELTGASCTAAGGFSPELADHLARETALEESRLNSQASRANADGAAPTLSYPACVSPRQILLEAAIAADVKAASAGPPSASYAAGRLTYEQQLLDFGLESIGDSPPASTGAVAVASSFALVVMPQQASVDCSNDVASEASEEEEETGAEAGALTVAEVEETPPPAEEMEEEDDDDDKTAEMEGEMVPMDTGLEDAEVSEDSAEVEVEEEEERTMPKVAPPVAPLRPNRTSKTSWLQGRAGSSSTLPAAPAGAERSDGESGSGDESGSEKEGQTELPVGWLVQDDVAQRPAMGDLVGRHVFVWWGGLGDRHWFRGEVTKWDINRQNSKGLHFVSYTDGDTRWHYLDGPSTEKFKWALQWTKP